MEEDFDIEKFLEDNMEKIILKANKIQRDIYKIDTPTHSNT